VTLQMNRPSADRLRECSSAQTAEISLNEAISGVLSCERDRSEERRYLEHQLAGDVSGVGARGYRRQRRDAIRHRDLAGSPAHSRGQQSMAQSRCLWRARGQGKGWGLVSSQQSLMRGLVLSGHVVDACS